MYADSLHERAPLLGRRSGTQPRPQLSELTIDLLQMSQPQDIGDFRAIVGEVYSKYEDAAIDARLKELLTNQYIKAHGSPSIGWLTLKGKGALAMALEQRS